MTKVLGIGNALVDIMIRMNDDNMLQDLNLPKGSMQLVDFDYISKINQLTAGLPTQLASGGSAANTIHGLANMGVQTGYIGAIGNDDNGKFFESDLRKAHITPLLTQLDQPSGVAAAMISPDSERTFGTFLGAACNLSHEHLTAELFEGYDYFHIEGYLVFNHDLVIRSLQLAKQKGLKISLDLASFNVVEANLEFLQKVSREYVDIIFANEEEAKAFTGMEPDQALEEIAKYCEIAVVKIGKKGSMVMKDGKKSVVGVIDAKCIDTTGAGDLYAAGFIYGLINNMNMEQCGKIGSILSGKVIEFIGAKIDAETWNVIRKMVKEL